MTTKLTLSIDEKTVQRAKILSAKRKKSISKIVEEYLDAITENEKNKPSPTGKLSGILKNKVPANMEWKEIKETYLRKKYGV